MYRVSFVCSGNICRSPSAEIVTRSLLADAGLADEVEVDSYGTGPWEVGEPAFPAAAAALRRRGYDGSAHVARQIGRADLADHDLVVALDRGHRRELERLRGGETGPEIRLLRDFDPDAPDGLDVDDPYYGDTATFERVLDEIEASARGLVEHLRSVVTAR